MMGSNEQPVAILALENGQVFTGVAIGAVDNVAYSCGEVVFNTAMTGYQEIISDPSYCEQIVMFTTPHIGNTGVNLEDEESYKVWSKGIIISSLSLIDSNWRSKNSLNNYLIKNNLIGIANIDTRALTHILRDTGSQRGCIYRVNQNESEDIYKKAIALARAHQSLENTDLAKIVSTKKSYYYNNGNSLSKYLIVVYDFGVKLQILNLLTDRNCRVMVVPAETSAAEVLKLKPDGIVLSNGPGDPAVCHYAIASTKEFIKQGIPIYGICLGFQILALAMGAKTVKMKFGHHGSNHPVKDLKNNKVMITSQNHGFMVDQESLTAEIIVTHRSLFDNTIQGLKHRTLPITSFQGHPEASPGPKEIEYLFDDFIENVINFKVNSTCRINEEKLETR